MYFETIKQLSKTLANMDKWFDAAVAHAQSKSFNPDVFLSLRLAPDQLPFSAQVQIACDTAKLGAARLTGKEVPAHADNEKTLEELRARVRSVRSILDGFTANDFAGAATRVISNPRWEGKTMVGAEWIFEQMIPNFYFHAAHTYAILRHNGVNLGKKDYIGQLSLR